MIPQAVSPSPGQLPQLYTEHDLVQNTNGGEYLFGQLGSAALAATPPSFLLKLTVPQPNQHRNHNA